MSTILFAVLLGFPLGCLFFAAIYYWVCYQAASLDQLDRHQ